MRLDAVIAPVLPATLHLPNSVVRSLGGLREYCEVRRYRGAGLGFLTRLKQSLGDAGVPCHQWQGTLVLTFPSLEARAETWTAITGKLRPAFLSYEFAVYEHRETRLT